MSDEKRVQPFATGFQYMDWNERNCCRCKKGAEGEETPVCPIELDLSYGAIDDGTVSEEMAKRMGYTDPTIYAWDCPEREDEPPPLGTDAYRSWVEGQGQGKLL